MKFTKAQYYVGEPICFSTDSHFEHPSVEIRHLEEVLYPAIEQDGDHYRISALPTGGYGIHISDHIHTEEAAFDVVASPNEVVRYGFLSDFSKKDNDTADVMWMKDLHINAVQFYDWMYKHDDLVSVEDTYLDPLGRETSLTSIKTKIEACKEYGMRPFAYGAVYAATEDSSRKHPEWCMYTSDHTTLTFADWLYFMNIGDDCGWRSHILAEFTKAVEFGFQGIHMDTYGFPKHVRDHAGHALDLEKHFPSLIDQAALRVKEKDPDAGVIFNAVNNWPIEKVATTGQDSAYIEVWSPNDTYYDLYTLIREARQLGSKNVILAAYLKAFKEADKTTAENSFKLSFASICASGGTQLVLGEERCVLSDSYYADHSPISDHFARDVQKYCDYLVRYNELLYNDTGMDISRTASDGINEDICFSAENASFSSKGLGDHIWTIIRRSDSLLTIQLINLLGNNDLWNVPKNTPEKPGTCKIRVRLDKEIKSFWTASPDADSLEPVSLPFQERTEAGSGKIYEVTIPSISYWTTVWAHTEE